MTGRSAADKRVAEAQALRALFEPTETAAEYVARVQREHDASLTGEQQ